jgi:hypothetical protein
MNEVADALRKVTAVVQAELEAGRRSAHLDANDLVELLLAVADEIDPPLAKRNDAPSRGR